MGYLLRMSDEIHDWLAGLRGSDPAAAVRAGEALTALMSEGASLGPPLAVPAAGAPRPEDLMEALDQSYQDKLEQLAAARRRAADAATAVKEMRGQSAELESARANLDEQYRRLQARTDAFRIRKETLKAAYVAARASVLVQETIAIPGAGDDGRGEEGDPGEAITEAAARLRDATAEIERELGREAWPAGLLELRPGAPGDSDIRVLFAVEPPGTALLIAVLEGREAVRDHHREAVMLSADVLWRARAGQAPEAVARAYDDTRSFLDEFFPGDAGEIEADAAALVARTRARTLAEQRIRLGLTQAEVAQRMGVRQERVSAIERAQPGATEIRTLAAYIEALGGRLRITAEFSGEDVPLR